MQVLEQFASIQEKPEGIQAGYEHSEMLLYQVRCRPCWPGQDAPETQMRAGCPFQMHIPRGGVRGGENVATR